MYITDVYYLQVVYKNILDSYDSCMIRIKLPVIQGQY